MAGSAFAKEPRCKVEGCGLSYSLHTKGPCPWCGAPVEHHTPERTEQCRAGKARMARAREAAGLPLTDIDRAALIGAGS